MTETFRPKNDRVLVLIDKPKTLHSKKEGKKIYAATGLQAKGRRGTVIAVGPGRHAELTGVLIPMSTAAGERVVIGSYSGTEVMIEQEVTEKDKTETRLVSHILLPDCECLADIAGEVFDADEEDDSHEVLMEAAQKVRERSKPEAIVSARKLTCEVCGLPTRTTTLNAKHESVCDDCFNGKPRASGDRVIG